MGFSGNLEPQYIIPTVLATKAEEGGLASTAAKRDGIEDLDFHVGDAAFDNSSSYQLNYPIRHGLIDNWDNMERLWQRCIFEYLRVEPEDHYVLLTGTTPSVDLGPYILEYIDYGLYFITLLCVTMLEQCSTLYVTLL
jgi:actin-related protein